MDVILFYVDDFIPPTPQERETEKRKIIKIYHGLVPTTNSHHSVDDTGDSYTLLFVVQ